MNVKQLIEILSGLDQDLHVFISGYEGGYHYVNEFPKEKIIALGVYSEWYYGPHEDAEIVEKTKPGKEYELVNGIIL